MELSLKQTTQLKAIAIVFVIIGHLHLVKNAGAWGVGLFLILSGYGLVISYNKKGLDNFFKNKILKVLMSYSLITTLWILIDTFLGEGYSFINIVTSILGLNFKAVVDSTMWYIPYIFLFYIAFYFTYKFINNKYLKMIVLLIFSLLLYVFANKIFDKNVGANIYVFQFPIGVMLATFKEEIKKIMKNEKLVYGIILIFSLIVGAILYGRISNILTYLLNINAICFAVISLWLLIGNRDIKLLEFVGKISFNIYLIEAVFMWKYTFIFDLIKNKFVAIIIYSVFILIIAYVMDKIFNKLHKAY